MKTKTFLTVIVILIINYQLSIINCTAQSPNWLWAKAMGDASLYNDIGKSIAIDASGNVYTTGYFGGTVDFDPGAGIFNLTSVGDEDIFISKLDNSGNFVWAKAMGGTNADEGYSIALDPSGSGDVYTTGHFQGTVDFDPGAGTFNLTASFYDTFISKLNSAGNFIWAKAVMVTSGSFVAIDTAGDGDVYTTGLFSGTIDFDPGAGIFNLTAAGTQDIFISKLDSSGNFVWAIAMGGTDFARGRYVALDPAGSGNVYITGQYWGTVDFDPGAGVFNLTSTSAGYDTFISKYDSSGNFVWAKAMGVGSGTSITLDPAGSGDVYTTGIFSGTVDFDPGAGVFNLTSVGGLDIFISKLNNSGNFIWAKAIGGAGYDYGNSIALYPAGNGDVYTTGTFAGTVDFDPGAGVFNLSSAGSGDVFISKLDSSGNFAWAKHIGGISSDGSNSLALDASGRVHVAGGFASPSISFGSTTLTNGAGNSTADIFIAKLDSAAIITGNNDVSPDASGSLNVTNIFPNPVTSELRIEGAESGIKSVDIYDVVGEKILHCNLLGVNKAIVDISTLNPGIYLVAVRDEKNNLTVRKLVKNSSH